MTIDIDRLTANELLALNHRIVERLKCRSTRQAHHVMMTFNIGSRVSRDSRQGCQLGTLTKFNRKTVTVVIETANVGISRLICSLR